MYHCWKHRFMKRIQKVRGVWFHLIGIIALLWFIIRVLPAPHRARYPCQQISLGLALTYIGFWSALFTGFFVWIKQVNHQSKHLITSIGVVSLVIALVATGVFAGVQTYALDPDWTPTPNQPIGVPTGLNPGRVVWTWNPDATEKNSDGYWWYDQNNNVEVIESMMQEGIQELAGIQDEGDAWDALFRYFNDVHGKGEIGYQTGEKIAIKINLNNCWEWCVEEYIQKDNQRDASPHVVKALLRKLINVAGVDQEDITVYDASRKMENWFYRRVYYESYPAIPLQVEFPDVHFVDSTGGWPGREQVIASEERIYFADGTGLYRTLPTCVVEADYLINMPLLKRHPIQQGITLSAKNLFGTFMEEVLPLHPYHQDAFIEGNPAPQVDLIGHEHLGGKTLLYLGDGLYPTKIDHRTIEKFQMYPFNDDWGNSLFFSQDPVAIDSVMYDFLHEEGTQPVEGSQFYLHQEAEPNLNTYDPENDGEYLTHSLGVHEHGNISVSIFSSDRYVGSGSQGIDYIALGEEYAIPGVVIIQPDPQTLYISGEPERNLSLFSRPLILGPLMVSTLVNGVETVESVQFYLDDQLQETVTTPPYLWEWDNSGWFRGILRVEAETNDGLLSDELLVWKIW